MIRIEKTTEEKDLERMQLYHAYENGEGVGTVNNIKNVNTSIWKDFKEIARLYGNSEGAAFTACVQAFMSNPANMAKILQARGQ